MSQRSRDIALAVAVVAVLLWFFIHQLRKNLSGPLETSTALARSGWDYEAARARDGFATSGEDHRIVRGADPLIPGGTTIVAIGPWIFERHCRYYLYPRTVLGKGYAQELDLDKLRRIDAALVQNPGSLDPASPLLDTQRFEARPIVGTTAVVYLDRRSPHRNDPAPPRPVGGIWPYHAVPEFGIPQIALVLLTLLGFLAVGLAIAGGRSLSTAFLLGVGALSVYAVLLTWLHVPLNRWTLGGFCGVALVVAAWRVKRDSDDWSLRRWTLAAIAIPLGIATLFALGAPMNSGDDLSHWGMRAKVYYAIGAVDTPGAAKGAFVLNYYPPLVSTSLAWIYIAAGGVVEGPAKLLFPAFLVAALGALASALGRMGLSSPRVAAWVAILGFSGNELILHGGFAWADLPLAAFVIAAVSWIHRGMMEGRRIFLVWGGVFAGLGAWTKAEGVPTALILIAPALLTKDWRRWLAVGVPVAAAILSWSLHCRLYDYPVTSEHFGGIHFERAGVVARKMGLALITPWHWGWGWFIAAAAIGIGIRYRRRMMIYPAAVWVLHLLFIGSTYIVTGVSHSIELQIGYTVTRLLLHVWPVLLYTAAISLTDR